LFILSLGIREQYEISLLQLILMQVNSDKILKRVLFFSSLVIVMIAAAEKNNTRFRILK